jgi:hemoglobin
MDELPEARDLRAMHHGELAVIREKLYEFLSGWLGGPQLYIEKHGHPRLRARHLPFSIGVAERDAWMRCMRLALAETVPDESLRTGLDHALARLADHMRNREEAGHP